MSAPVLPAHVDDALSANLDHLDTLAGNARALVSEYRLRRASAQGPLAAGNGSDLTAWAAHVERDLFTGGNDLSITAASIEAAFRILVPASSAA